MPPLIGFRSSIVSQLHLVEGVAGAVAGQTVSGVLDRASHNTNDVTEHLREFDLHVALILRNEGISQVQSHLATTLELFMLFCFHDKFEYFLHNQHEEIVFYALVEVFHIVQLVVLLALLEVLHNHRWVQLLLVFIAEQVKQEVTWDAQIKLCIVVLVWETTWPLVELFYQLELKVSLRTALS